MRLTGWRRLGVVLVALWVAGCICIMVVELTRAPRGFFVERLLPQGAVVRGDKAELPGGRIVELNARDPVTGQIVSPWNIDWNNQPNLPTSIQWLRLAIVGIVVPLAIWLLIELLVIAGAWVARGFKLKR